MITELINFIESLDPEIKSLGLKPKEGLHILLRLQNEDGRIFLDKNSLEQTAFTRNKESSPAEIAFLKRCAELTSLVWCVNTNKCFDLPIKAIHSCSPYCVAIKRENLKGGEKWKANDEKNKNQVYDFERMHRYFSNAIELIEDEPAREKIKIFETALTGEDNFESWLDLCPEYELLKDSDYVIFYLDTDIVNVQITNAKYLADKLFNTNNHNAEYEGQIFGTSDFLNSFPTKKPFLTHQSASFDIAKRVSSKTAKNLFEFQELMSRNILPKPLPIFIHQDEIIAKDGKSLAQPAMRIFKSGASNEDKTTRLTYRKVLEELHKTHETEISNYYLLFYERGEIKDFDFVPKFEFLLLDEHEKSWEIEDFFNGNNAQRIQSVFNFQEAVLYPIFNGGLIVRTKAETFQYKYFDELDAKYLKSNVTLLLIMQYRRAFYDFVYKSKRQAVTAAMFNDILQKTILDDIRLDEMKNNFHTQGRSIREKLNIWFSLQHLFTSTSSTKIQNMGNKLKEHREFIVQLTQGADIENDEQYAFAAGQVIAYLMSKSKTADRSYQRLEPFLQQVKSSQLNMAISRMFATYKHENFSGNFRNPLAQVLAYTTTNNLRELMPIFLSGIFSKNALFSNMAEDEELEPLTEELTEPTN